MIKLPCTSVCTGTLAVWHGQPGRRLASALMALLLAGCASLGDYGDAPDNAATGYPPGFAQTGSFPTLAASGGASAADVGQATLGPSASTENDANDPADPDGQPNLNPANTDTDNGVVDFVVMLVSIPPPAVMTVNVSGPAGSAGGTYFVNVLIDLNLDGRWGGTAGPGLPEWVVHNFPVQVTAGVSTQVPLPPFNFGFGNRLPDGAWMRILLSREPVSAGDWNGSGQFSAGEVEDHVITLPLVAPNKRIVIQMNCDDPVRFPRGASRTGFKCWVSNAALGATAGSFTYTLGAVTNRPSVIVTPLPPNAVIGCLPPPPFAAGGPVTCGVVPSIPIAGAGPVFLNFRADQVGPLPSQWTYWAGAVDPPAVVTDKGVTIGFGGSQGEIRFTEVEVQSEASVEIGDGEATLVMKAKDPAIKEDIRVPVGPGEDFRGLGYEKLLEHGKGAIRLPEAP
jgi:hypothetical protein